MEVLKLNLPVSTNVVVKDNERWPTTVPTGLDNISVVIGNQYATKTYAVSWDSVNAELFHLEAYKKNQDLLIEAVRNFIRKNNFAELDESLTNEEISLEEYEAELDKNLHKYAITLKDIQLPFDVDNVIFLVDKIGKDLKEFSLSEVSEMFSINENQLLGHITYGKSQIK